MNLNLEIFIDNKKYEISYQMDVIVNLTCHETYKFIKYLELFNCQIKNLEHCQLIITYAISCKTHLNIIVSNNNEERKTQRISDPCGQLCFLLNPKRWTIHPDSLYNYQEYLEPTPFEFPLVKYVVHSINKPNIFAYLLYSDRGQCIGELHCLVKN